MEKNLSTFETNHTLFMERFPKLAWLLTRAEQTLSPKETFLLPDLKQIDVLYFYGIGQGEAYFLAKAWLHEQEKRRLIFLSDDFSQFLEQEEALSILSDPQVICDNCSEIQSLTERFPFSRVEVACLPSLKKKKFHSLRLKILRHATLSYALHTDRLYGDLPFSNFIQNVKQLPHSFYANGLKNRFQAVPAIVCGAGPSLQRAMPHLKKMEDKALIIAGGSTLAALSSQGVTPHFGMAIDPNLEEFKRMKNSFAFEVPFLYSTRVFPSVFQTCNGPFGYLRAGIGGLLELWIEEELGLTDPLIGEHLSNESISVTTICLAWAQFLGCNPIILNGVDLAYTDKKHYAAGVDGDSSFDSTALKETAAAGRILKRKDRLGRPIFTAVRWIMESASISHFAKMHSDIEFINTTEGGIEIKKIGYRPLEELERQLKTIDLKRKVQEEIFRSPMPSQSAQIIETKINEMRVSLDRLISSLEVLSNKNSPLDELELADEMAYSYLFYDIHQVLDKEVDAKCFPREKWRQFLQLAKRYRSHL